MDVRAPSLSRGEVGFDRHLAAAVFNDLPVDRSPDLVVTPRTEEEVAEIVRAAAQAGQRISVLSGGHSWIVAPVRDSGVLIDMSSFAQIEVDRAARIARIGPAARSGALAKALAAEGLAFSSGHCGTPAFGGYVLGGGLGLNWGRWKPACYSVRSLRVVSATGEILVASESEHEDLRWLARGVGPGFPGVVTEFEVELQTRPADTRVSSWLFPLDDLAAVSRWVSEASPSLPSTVEVATALLGPERPDHLPSEGFPDHVVTVTALVFADDEAEAIAALAPLADGPRPAAHAHLEPIPIELLHEAFDAEYPQNHRYLADSFWTDEDTEGSLVRLADEFRRAPSGKNNVIALMPGNGATLGLDPEVASYSMDERTLVMHYAIWQDAEKDQQNRAWHSAMSSLLEPISTGHFVSEADLLAHPERLPRCFTPENWDRVQALRSKWDPEGVFHGFPGERERP